MSTELTNNDIQMVDSWTLQLVLGAAEIQELASSYLCSELMDRGFVITPASLNFLSTLESGTNYASEIARNIGVSRQMVAKTVKELCSKGYLDQIESTGKQKQITFTKKGEHLMSESRKVLNNIDKILTKTIKPKSLETTVAVMHSMRKALENKGK